MELVFTCFMAILLLYGYVLYFYLQKKENKIHDKIFMNKILARILARKGLRYCIKIDTMVSGMKLF